MEWERAISGIVLTNPARNYHKSLMGAADARRQQGFRREYIAAPVAAEVAGLRKGGTTLCDSSLPLSSRDIE